KTSADLSGLLPAWARIAWTSRQARWIGLAKNKARPPLASKAERASAQADITLYRAAYSRQAEIVRTGNTPQARVDDPLRAGGRARARAVSRGRAYRHRCAHARSRGWD